MLKHTPTPPMGWNSFDCYGCRANEAALLRNLDVFVERLKPHGYEYLVLDGGWYREYELKPGEEFPARPMKQQVLDDYGRPNPARWAFPNGLQPIIDRVHDAGVKFGIHMMRGIGKPAVEANVPILGTEYHAQDIAQLDNTCRWCPDNVGVDVDHPGGQAFYDSIIRVHADWGVDFIKYDDIVPHPKEIEAVVKAIENVDREIVLSLSPGNGHDPAAINTFAKANMMRITGDVWDDRVYFQFTFQRWAEFLEAYGKVPQGFWLDQDMIPFGHLKVNQPIEPEDAEEKADLHGKGYKRMSRLNEAQKRTFITMQALGASPLMMGGDLPTTDEYSFELITNSDMLACNRNGVIGRPVKRADNVEIWHTPDATAAGSGWFGIFNRRADKDLLVELSQDLLPIPADARLQSIWTREDPGTIADRPSCSVTPDDVLFVRYG